MIYQWELIWVLNKSFGNESVHVLLRLDLIVRKPKTKVPVWVKIRFQYLTSRPISNVSLIRYLVIHV